VISASWGTLNQFTSSKGNSEVQGSPPNSPQVPLSNSADNHSALVRMIVAALNSLPAVRYQIDILNYTSTEVISFYSTLNTNLINVAGNLDRPDSGAVCKVELDPHYVTAEQPAYQYNYSLQGYRCIHCLGSRERQPGFRACEGHSSHIPRPLHNRRPRQHCTTPLFMLLHQFR